MLDSSSDPANPSPKGAGELRRKHAMWEANLKAFYENSKIAAEPGPPAPKK